MLTVTAAGVTATNDVVMESPSEASSPIELPAHHIDEPESTAEEEVGTKRGRSSGGPTTRREAAALPW